MKTPYEWVAKFNADCQAKGAKAVAEYTTRTDNITILCKNEDRCLLGRIIEELE